CPGPVDSRLPDRRALGLCRPLQGSARLAASAGQRSRQGVDARRSGFACPPADAAEQSALQSCRTTAPDPGRAAAATRTAAAPPERGAAAVRGAGLAPGRAAAGGTERGLSRQLRPL